MSIKGYSNYIIPFNQRYIAGGFSYSLKVMLRRKRRLTSDWHKSQSPGHGVVRATQQYSMVPIPLPSAFEP